MLHLVLHCVKMSELHKDDIHHALSFFGVFAVKVKVLMTFNYIVKIRAKDAVILLFSKAINSID